jgi:DNA-binding HxlR family transcriptional regulator
METAGSTRMTYPYDVFDDRCPTRMMLDRLADKWALLVLDRLDGGPVRFNRLRRDVRGISQKVLSQTLKRLERDGLVNRTVHPTVPVSVEYALTPLGRTLTETVAALAHWAERNMEAVLTAQAAYDAAAAG